MLPWLLQWNSRAAQQHSSSAAAQQRSSAAAQQRSSAAAQQRSSAAAQQRPLTFVGFAHVSTHLYLPRFCSTPGNRCESVLARLVPGCRTAGSTTATTSSSSLSSLSLLFALASMGAPRSSLCCCRRDRFSPSCGLERPGVFLVRLWRWPVLLCYSTSAAPPAIILFAAVSWRSSEFAAAQSSAVLRYSEEIGGRILQILI